MIESPPALSPERLRDIIPLLGQDDVSATIREINDRYDYWTEYKYKKQATSLSNAELWTLARFTRGLQTSRIKLTAKRYTEVFRYTVPTPMHEKLHFLDRNYGYISENDQIQSEREKKKLQISSIMEEAIASSQIEGAVTTRAAAKEMLRAGRKPRNVSEQMIVNNYNAIQELNQYKSQPMSLELLQSIHATVTKYTLDDPALEGKLRENNEVHVVDAAKGDVVHIPPDCQYLAELLEDLCRFTNNQQNFIHPIVKASILHFLIGYLHPFYDGNGRTARALFYWYLLKHNYWLIEYVSISRLILKSRVQYADAYLQSEKDNNDMTYFIKFQIKILEDSFENLKQYLNRKREEKKKTSELLRSTNFNYRQIEILQKALEAEDFEISIKQYEGKMNVSFGTARSDLLNLETYKLFNKVKRGKTLVFFPSADFNEVLRHLLTK